MTKIYFFFLYLHLVAVRPNVYHLQRITSPNVNFSLSPAFNLGLYTTTIELGYPSQNFTVLIDTGSDITWLPCKSCINCPQYRGGDQVLHHFDTNISTGEMLVQCREKRCQCSSDSCKYKITYEDHMTASSGYFLEDRVWMDNNTSSAHLIFGCSTKQYGRLAEERPGFDGILGFNQDPLSVVSQLRINAFSYCLNELGNNNGFLLFGEALHPSLVYSPMVPRTSHYGLYLERIIVNQKTLAIHPKIFGPSKTSRGTIVDSGTNTMFLVGEAYDELINVVNSFVSPYAILHVIRNNQMCYQINISISKAFPTIFLKFAHDATLQLNPEQYLVRKYTLEDPLDLWCIGIIRTKDITILGDPIFHNKLIVYDLARQRIGWVNHDCSISNRELEVNLSIIPGHTNTADQQQIRYIKILYLLVIFFFSLSM